MSDNDFAKVLKKEERLLFNKIERHNRRGLWFNVIFQLGKA